MFVKGTTTNNVHQKILEEVFDFYQSPTDHEGLCEIAKDYGLDAIPPKKRIWILLIGNHSAGKSSYINWYVEESVQKTSVAIETTGFTLITSGKRRETLRGQATIRFFDCLRDLTGFKGVMAFLSTEIVTSRSKNFSMVTFIDTPGLVDGEMSYPFDPEKTMLRLATEADLIFTFFDPIGQALCKRTMNVVEKLCISHGHKVYFFLSKADTVPDEYDRQRVLIQIAQNLTGKLRDRQFSLSIPPIFVPEKESVPVRNHVQETLTIIENAINMRVQKSLENLEDDCKKISDTIRTALRDYDENRSSKSFYVGFGKRSNRKLDRNQMKKHLHVTSVLGPELYRRLYTEYFDTHGPVTSTNDKGK
ncbi:hypothetical protein HDU67_005989 [Dinochytrium kinnereticum]|nr:hypothetical protein HDU67_005989 [Dinochytrium kinnereticum]